MKVLFNNTVIHQCGVYQYGISLFENLCKSQNVQYDYFEASSGESLRQYVHDGLYNALIYNWHPNIGGWMIAAPFKDMPKQIIVYHDGTIDHHLFDAVLFSDPSMPDHSNWFSIGRPIPVWNPQSKIFNPECPVIGTNGFLGAWSPLVVDRIRTEFKTAKIRLLLPSAYYGDSNGILSKQASDYSRSVSGNGLEIEICNDFLAREALLKWLSENDANCYFRDKSWQWTGIASAPDFALAVKKPIVVNGCNAFRHFHHCIPSVRIEDRTIGEIIQTGIEPLKPLYDRFSSANINSKMESILQKIVK